MYKINSDNPSLSQDYGGNLSGVPNLFNSSESKIKFLLSVLEPLIVNDQNNETAAQHNMIDLLLQVLATQDKSNVHLRSFIKSALRCLTSAIRTEPAVSKVTFLWSNSFIVL